MPEKRLINTFENSKLKIVQAIELNQHLQVKAEGVELEITRADAREIEFLAERFKDVNPAKWAKIVKGGQYLQLGQYVGAISTSNLNIIISPKVDEIGKSGVRKQEGCVDLSILVRSAKSPNLPKEEFAQPGVMDWEIFFLHAERFIKDLSDVISFGLRCGYVPTSEDLKSLRGTLDTDRLAIKAGVTPELIPCKFEEFEENTLHNQILRRAVAIIRFRLQQDIQSRLLEKPPLAPDSRSAPLVRMCDELLELLNRVSDVPLQWSDIASLQLSSLEFRYPGIFHYAKLLIKCAAPLDQDMSPSPGTISLQSGFSQVWDAAILYERHIANYLEQNLREGQRQKARYQIRTQRKCLRLLVTKLNDDAGYYEILPDIIIWDNKLDRAHLIIDTKWKKHDGTMADARQADAYQVHAYATTYSEPYKTKTGINKIYYPPVCLLYPSIGAARGPVVGEFCGTKSRFILASAPMNKTDFEFDPSIVLGEEWPLRPSKSDTKLD